MCDMFGKSAITANTATVKAYVPVTYNYYNEVNDDDDDTKNNKHNNLKTYSNCCNAKTMEKKIYVLGGPGCGKSSLLYALTGEEAVTDCTTSKVFARRSTTVEITSEVGGSGGNGNKNKLLRRLLSFCCCGYKKKQRQPTLTTHTESITLVFLEALEQEGRLRAMNYLDTDAVLLCFDVNTYKSLEDLKEKWIPEVNYYCPDEVPIILVGLKGDAVKPNPGREPLLRRTSSFFRVRKLDTTQREAERLLNEEHIYAYLQCSAQDGRGLNELKKTLTKAVTTSVSRSISYSKAVKNSSTHKNTTSKDTIINNHIDTNSVSGKDKNGIGLSNLA